MRQRSQTEDQPPLTQFSRRLKQQLVGKELDGNLVTEMTKAESPGKQIPDEVLVALAVLQQLNPGSLIEQPGPASTTSKVWPRTSFADHPLSPLVDEAVKEHEAKFGSWSTVTQYRARFLEITTHVRVC